MQRSLPLKPKRYQHWLALALITFSFALVLYQLGHNSLWSDEIVTAQLTRQPLKSMLREMFLDPNHLPGYYLLQWLFSWAGKSEWAVRLPSALAATLTVAAVYRLGYDLVGYKTGLIAAALLATHPYQLWAAQEARYYALIGVWASLSALTLLRLWRSPGKVTALAFIICTIGALYTHFFCLFMVAAEAAATFAWLIWSIKNKRQKMAVFLAWFGLALLYLPLLPRLLNLRQVESAQALPMFPPEQIRALLLFYSNNNDIVAIAAVIAVICGLLAIYQRNRWAALLMFAWFTPLAVMTTLRSTHFFHLKYLHYLFPIWMTLISAGLTAVISILQKRLYLRYDYSLIALLAVAINLWPLQAYYHTEKYDWRAATAYLAQVADPKDIVINAPPTGPELQWYYPKENRAKSVIEFANGRKSIDKIQNLDEKNSDIYWLVYIPTGYLKNEAALEPAFTVQSFYGVLVLHSKVPVVEAAETLLNVIAPAYGQDAVLAGPAWDTLGELLERRNKPEQAIAAYQQALRSFFEPRVIHRLNGDIARLQGNWEAAAAEYQEAIQPTPDLPEVYLRLGEAKYRLGENNAAVTAYLQYQRLTGKIPDNLRQLNDLASLLPEAAVSTPSVAIDTPYCNGNTSSSCYVARTTFTIPATGEKREVIFAHPDTKLEFTLSLPVETSFFIASPLIDPQSWNWGGDGVTFRIWVTEDNSQPKLLAEKEITPAQKSWADWVVPLEKYAGESIKLILETSSEPSGNSTGDWSGWGNPLTYTLN